MAEEAVKRISGLNPMFHAAMPEISAMSIPSFSGSPSDSSADAAAPVPDDSNHQYFQPPSDNPPTQVKNSLADISSTENMPLKSGAAAVAGTKIVRSASMQRVASLEHLQKRIRGAVTSPSAETKA